MSTDELLQAINEKLDDVREWQTRQTVVCEARGELLTDLKRTLWGNGKLGLETRVDRIETYAKAATTSVKVAWTVVTAAIAAIAAVAGHLLGG